MTENLEGRRKQLHEINRYKDNAFPVGMYLVTKDGIIPDGRGFNDLHWHEELQLTYIMKGKAKIQINGTDHVLEEGEAIFINKNVMHVISELSEDGKYISFNFKDRMLCFFAGSRMEQEDVLPYTSQYAFPSIVFRKETRWEATVLAYILELYHIFLDDGPKLKRRNYRVSIILSEIWYQIINNVEEKELTASSAAVRSQDRIQQMLLFVHQNYKENVQLHDIAEAANISEGECCRCFKSIVRKSPIQYVIDYRISKAMELLMDTDLSITEVASNTGFPDTSHFIKYFKRKMGITPKEYRRMGN